jgi:hypothetical protein
LNVWRRSIWPLRVGWRRVWTIIVGGTIRLRIGRRSVGPLGVRIRRTCGRRTVIALIVRSIVVRGSVRLHVRGRRVRAVSIGSIIIGRTVRLPIVVGPVRVRWWRCWPVIWLNVASLRCLILLLPRTINVLRWRSAVPRISLLGRCWPRRRSHPHRHCSSGLLGLRRAHLRNCWRLATILADELLLPVDTRRRRWRRCPSNHSATHNLLGGTGLCWPAAPCEGLPFGWNRRCSRRDLCVGDLPFVNAHNVPAHRLRPCHYLRGRSGHRARNALVYIRHVVDRRLVDDHVVVIVVDHGGVHRSIRDVHVVHVGAANVIRRDIDFARPQREPAHG